MRKLLSGIALLSLLSSSLSADIIRDKNGAIPAAQGDFTTGTLPAGVTFTRAGNGTLFNSSGTLTTVGTNVPRFDYDPNTLVLKGLLIEPGQTNAIRNNTMVGLVPGTPGTLPTNWAGGAATINVIGSGVENGITYGDFQFTTAGIVGGALLSYDAIAQQAAAPNDTWTCSYYIKLVGGSLTNVTDFEATTRYYDAGSAFLTQTFTSVTPTASGLATQRTQATGLAPASTAFVNCSLRLNTSGAINATIRVGMPQLEKQNYATSVIATAGSTVGRSLDQATLATTINPNTWSLWWKGSIPGAPASGGVSLKLLNIGDGTSNNRGGLLVTSSPGILGNYTTAAGSAAYNFNIGSPNAPLNSIFTAGASRSPLLAVAEQNGTNSASTGTVNGAIVTPTTVFFGADATNSVSGASWIQKYKFFNSALSIQQLSNLQ